MTKPKRTILRNVTGGTKIQKPGTARRSQNPTRCPVLPIAIPDADLIAAGVEFRILQGLLLKARRLSQPNYDALEAAKRSGILHGGLEEKALDEQFERIEKLVPLPVPCCDDITDAMGPVIDRIITLPATTIEGLAAKACIVGWAYDGKNGSIYEFDGCHWDEDGNTVRALVEAVSAVAGRSS